MCQSPMTGGWKLLTAGRPWHGSQQVVDATTVKRAATQRQCVLDGATCRPELMCEWVHQPVRCTGQIVACLVFHACFGVSLPHALLDMHVLSVAWPDFSIRIFKACIPAASHLSLFFFVFLQKYFLSVPFHGRCWLRFRLYGSGAISHISD